MLFDKFQVGQRIRAEDFASRRDCYVEGPILEVVTEGRSSYPAPHYVIQAERLVWAGEDKPVDPLDRTLVPIYCFRDWGTRIQLVVPS
jgi:hypothetical protein